MKKPVISIGYLRVDVSSLARETNRIFIHNFFILFLLFVILGDQLLLLSFGVSFTSSQERKCKTWQNKYLSYTEQHEQRLNLVAHTIGGLSDSATGLVTSFLLAYCSGRRFYLTKDSVFTNSVRFGFNVSIHDSNARSTIILDKKLTKELLLKVLKAKERTIHVKGNRGAVYKIVTSSEFKKVDSLQLLEVGSDYIFGCILRLLVIPTQSTINHFQSEINKLKRNPQIMKIGVQIRTRSAMQNPGLGIKDIISNSFYKLFLDCAVAVSRESKKPVIIFIVSDSVELRYKLIADLEKVGISAFTTKVERMREIYDAKIDSATNLLKWKISHGEEVFGESFLLSLCDVFVYTKQSGFGRVAAARSMRENAYYPISERKRIGSISSAHQCLGPGFSMKFIENDSAGL